MFFADFKINCGVLCSFLIVIVVVAALMAGGSGVARGQLLSKEHRTSLAIQNTKELSCYHCNTMVEGERCEKLDNNTDLHLKCKDERMCMVKSISLTTSTGNSTSKPSLWLLERNCSKHCDPGCIVIGERTKLYACTKCCEADFCNSGRSTAPAGTIITTTTVKCVQQLYAAILTYISFASIFNFTYKKICNL